jgi:hypothetical protein
LTLAAVGFERYAKTTRRAAFLAEMQPFVRPLLIPHQALVARHVGGKVGLTCPINPEFSRISGGARAPGSYRTSPERPDPRAWAHACADHRKIVSGAGLGHVSSVFLSF